MTHSPIVIAHRGASGYLPEHTLASKALAFGLGADFIEQDVVATRDSELVVFHDLYLDDMTNVAECFPDRRRDDGRHYVIDFDLAELQTLLVHERRASGTREPKFPQRFPGERGMLRIATLDEELRLIQGLNKTMRRTVGVYPEIKHPRWHAENGIDLTKAVLTKLATYGYRGRNDAAYLQCFDAAELRRAREILGCELNIIQLIEPDPSFADMLSTKGLRAVAEYACGIGPNHTQLLRVEGGRLVTASLTGLAHDTGLYVHAYTFRRDDLPPYASSLEEMLELFFDAVGVDGVFCDHPDIAIDCRRRRDRAIMDTPKEVP